MKISGLLARRVAVCVSLVFACGVGQAALIGEWTFDGANPYADQMGNFGNLQLKGSASVSNGALVVTGGGGANSATGWGYVGSYSGATIVDKTLVSWVTMRDFNSWAGSALTIDRIGSDNFDGIIFGERQTQKWMNGSSGFSRTQDFNPGFQETTANVLVQLAITYQNLGNGTELITGYRNGVNIGSYTSGNVGSWSAGDTEIFFGQRHGGSNGGPGGINANIAEARIYNTALTQAEIQSLTMSDSASAPEPGTYGLTALALAMLGCARRRKG